MGRLATNHDIITAFIAGSKEDMCNKQRHLSLEGGRLLTRRRKYLLGLHSPEGIIIGYPPLLTQLQMNTVSKHIKHVLFLLDAGGYELVEGSEQFAATFTKKKGEE